tara:strand:+ start:657 stop:1232 length:576 start_codon:yes stop_codon:yes gene_type:complete
MAAPRPFDEDFCRRNAGTVATTALKWLAGRVRHRQSGSCAEFRKKIVHILRIFCGQGTRRASFHRPSGALVLIFRKFLPRLMHRYHTIGYAAMKESGVRVFTEARVVAMLTCVGNMTNRKDWLLAMKLVSEVMFVHAVRLHQSKLLRHIKKQQEARDAHEVKCVGVVSAQDALNAKFQAAEDNGSMIDLTQ